MMSYTPVTQQGDCDGVLSAWWTDCDFSCDFCIVLDRKDSDGVSLNLSYSEAKRLYHVLNKKLKGAQYYDE